MTWQLGSVRLASSRSTSSMSPFGPIVKESNWSITTPFVSIVLGSFTAFWSPTLTEFNVEFSIMRRVKRTRPE